MNRNPSEDENNSIAKKLKLNKENDQKNNQIGVAVAVVGDNTEEENADANNISPPSIFKLDIDCCEELFEYLPLKDLHSLGQTCKKMHQFTGYFVRENYKSTQFEWKNGHLCLCGIRINGFIEYISNLLIVSNRLEQFAEYAPRFKSLRKLCLQLEGGQINCIKEILYECEEIVIRFDRYVLTIDLYEMVLKFCTNLKHLKLYANDDDWHFSLVNNNWLLHEYPNLKYLDLYSNSCAKPAEIRTFFTLNKEIEKFRTNSSCLWDCRHWIVDTDIKLNELAVDYKRTDNLNRRHIILLNELYERGFYKHLSLHKEGLYDSSILTEICSPLTIELSTCNSPIPQLNLKEFNVLKTFIDDIQLENVLANNVSTIERVHFYYLNTWSISLLIRKFMKLKEIKIDCLYDMLL